LHLSCNIPPQCACLGPYPERRHPHHPEPAGISLHTFHLLTPGNIFWLDGILHRLFEFFHLRVFYSQHLFYIQTIKDFERLAYHLGQAGWFPSWPSGPDPFPSSTCSLSESHRDMLKLFYLRRGIRHARYVLWFCSSSTS